MIKDMDIAGRYGLGKRDYCGLFHQDRGWVASWMHGQGHLHDF